MLPFLISHQQTAHIHSRSVSETGRLISDILEIADTLNLKSYLVTIDVDKTFDLLNHFFLMTVLKKFHFGPSFLERIETVLKIQESCVISTDTTALYFKLQKGEHQGDPISAYFFILH